MSFKVTYNLADKSFYQDPTNFEKISDTSINKIINLLNFDDILKPNVYDPKNRATDMTNMPKTRIVVYAQNSEDFNKQLAGGKPQSRGGSASVQGQDNAHGIPTGYDSGWKSLDDTFKLFDGKVVSAKQLIDLCIVWLEQKIKKGIYTCIVYPSDDNGMWSNGIFSVNADVKKYISFKLIGLMCSDDVAAKLRESSLHEQDLSQFYACPY